MKLNATLNYSRQFGRYIQSHKKKPRQRVAVAADDKMLCYVTGQPSGCPSKH